MDNDSIKDNLYRLRKKLDMTQQQMADKIGISRNAYADLESGVTRILNEKIESVARLADVSVEELCLGYKPRTSAQDVSALRSPPCRRSSVPKRKRSVPKGTPSAIRNR